MSQHFDLIVVGGGPAGSTAAAAAAKAGLSVLLLEADKHPRMHVGESLLPGIIPILERIGALHAVEEAGFAVKTGSTHWGWGLTPEWDLWFTDSEEYDHAWLVERARFDEILFRAAIAAGAEVHDHAAVKSYLWDGDRVVGVEWKKRGENTLRTARATWTLDATGQAALLARQLELRTPIPGFQHEASFAHFENCRRLPEPRARQALFIAEDRHWLWYFPLDDGGKGSIGMIRRDDTNAPDGDRARYFEETIAANPALQGVIGPDARRITPVYNIRDWSYSMKQVGGPGWLLAGDSSGFIDPVLSSGVLLAMHAGANAADAVVRMKSGELSEADALAEYAGRHRRIFEDMVRIVRYFYDQNKHMGDYFWESKRILETQGSEIKPRKAFMTLTSGLARNLWFDRKKALVADARATRIERASDLVHDPDQCGFICFHVSYTDRGEASSLYFVIEPIDSTSPTLFRTRNWYVNCLARRYKNDPISVPSLEPHLRRFDNLVRSLDTQAGENLALFWRRTRDDLTGFFFGLPSDFEFVRVFGE